MCASVFYMAVNRICVGRTEQHVWRVDDTRCTLNDSVMSALKIIPQYKIHFLSACRISQKSLIAVWIRKTRSHSTLNNVPFYFNVLFFCFTFWCSSRLLQVVVCFNFIDIDFCWHITECLFNVLWRRIWLSLYISFLIWFGVRQNVVHRLILKTNL